jgi:hypothetical protein
MSSAPRDGTKVLVCVCELDYYEVETAYWREGGLYPGWENNERIGEPDENWSGWMPMPARPEWVVAAEAAE